MSLLTLANVSKSFGTQTVLTDIHLTLAAGQKLGLIGRNGGGKTTLLRLILGQDAPDPSIQNPPRITVAAGRRLGYLRQEAPVDPERTIGEELEAALEPLRQAQARIQAAEEAMARADDEAALQAALAEHTEASDTFDALGGWAVESERETVLRRLGLGEAERHKRVGDCSGGEQTRLALARLALTRPDILILDEPTNHLDIAATEWLEGFLTDYPGAILLVSHDRAFLDAVADSIGELEHGTLTVWRGNYSHFLRQKEEAQARQLALYGQQQREIARLNDLIRRNMGADANASNIRHKTQGRIERMEKVVVTQADVRTVKARIDSNSAGRIGREAVRFEKVGLRYGARQLFSGLSGAIERGDRIGLVGPNGAGKSSLVRLILEQETPTQGTVAFGHNVRIGYFSQHACDDLDPTRTVLESLTDLATTFTETEARNYLGRFLFSGDDVAKRVALLSGGEKNKLALARMLLSPCNLLILDEPTNHLDIASVETLTRMLREYAGTLILVSHDRFLLSEVAQRTLALDGVGGAALVDETFADWYALRQAPTPPPPTPPTRVVAPTGAHADSKARERARLAVARAEEGVSAAEAALAAVEAKLAAPASSGSDVVALATEHAACTAAVEAALAEWEAAQASLDALS